MMLSATRKVGNTQPKSKKPGSCSPQAGRSLNSPDHEEHHLQLLLLWQAGVRGCSTALACSLSLFLTLPSKPSKEIVRKGTLQRCRVSFARERGIRGWDGCGVPSTARQESNGTGM